MSDSEPELFHAWGVHSLDDGGKSEGLIGVYTQEEDTKVVAAGRETLGEGESLLEKVPCIRVGSKVYLLVSETPTQLDQALAGHYERIRAIALSKLTPIEQRVLCLLQA